MFLIDYFRLNNNKNGNNNGNKVDLSKIPGLGKIDRFGKVIKKVVKKVFDICIKLNSPESRESYCKKTFSVSRMAANKCIVK